MAKDKTRKNKIPKKVAGVKVPKQLRKAGKQAMKVVKDPVLSEVVAAALLSAAAALKETKDPKVVPAAAGAASDAAEGAKKQAGKLSDALKVLAVDLARRAIDNVEKGNVKRRTSPDSAPQASSGE